MITSNTIKCLITIIFQFPRFCLLIIYYTLTRDLVVHCCFKTSFKMPTVNIKRDLLFEALGTSYSNYLQYLFSFYYEIKLICKNYPDVILTLFTNEMLNIFPSNIRNCPIFGFSFLDLFDWRILCNSLMSSFSFSSIFSPPRHSSLDYLVSSQVFFFSNFHLQCVS